ncbi:MAG: phosphoribosyltransferase family protein [Balneolaceae bacterium]|nr:phosphoribosyltransferase family protein [Balneolaceae bacterium]
MLKKIINTTKEIGRGISSIAFPSVCICCGLETTERDRQLCSFCKEERFVDANPENKHVSSDVLLPEIVSIQHALWEFDKGGVLQDLMHYLKYERLTGIGYEIGRLVARRAMKHPALQSLKESKDVILVPVPLHYLKFRKRGFNQAFMIAQGMQSILKTPICKIDSVIRQKNTSTQTGFTIEKRISNIKDAFRVNKPEAFKDKRAVIVDDVFTTGSTTFELARTLADTGISDTIILTAAQA